VKLVGLQIKGDTNYSSAVKQSSGNGCTVTGCILTAKTKTVSSDPSNGSAGNGINLINCLVLNTSGNTGADLLKGGRAHDCTFIGTAGTAISCTYFSVSIVGCAVFGFATFKGGGGSDEGDSGYNATDLATAFGSNNQVSKTFSAQFVNSASDWRAASSGSDLANNGTPISGITNDISLTTRNVTTPTIGCWELAASGITFDATSNSGYQAAQSTYSWSHTNAGNFLSVDVSMLSVPGTTVTGITFDGVALTKIGSQYTASTIGGVECWGLVAPSIGTKTIVVTLSGTIISSSEAVSYSGVNQATPTEDFNGAFATNVGAADATVTISPISDNTWIHGAVAATDSSITANQTSRNNVTGAGGSGANEDSGSAITPPAATATSFTGVGALQTWAIAGYAIIPVADADVATPSVALGSGTASSPSVILVYTASSGIALGTGTIVGPSVTFGPLSVTVGTSLGGGTATSPTVTFGTSTETPGIALGTGTAVDTSAHYTTTAIPGVSLGSGLVVDATVSLGVLSLSPGVAVGGGTAVDTAVSHGALTVTPDVALGTGIARKVRIAGQASGGGSRLLLTGAT
jgi:hypothetical protein